MADQHKTAAKAEEPAKQETPEEKAAREQKERDEKENEKREKLIGGFVEDLRKRLAEYGAEDLGSILREVQARVSTLQVVAAGADMGVQTASAVRELMAKHTPFITPATPAGKAPAGNIAMHVANMDEKEKDNKKKAA